MRGTVRVIIIVFIQLLFWSASPAQYEEEDITGKTAISIVDNLRIRESPDTGSKITGHINTGQIVKVEQRSKVKIRVKNTEDYWYRVTAGSRRGWVFGALITTAYQTGGGGNIILWYRTNEGDDYRTTVNYLNKKTKKRNSYKIEQDECTYISLSPDGKYFAQDCGTYAIRQMVFYLAESGSRVETLIYAGFAEWSDGSEMQIDEVIWDTERCYAVTSSVFKGGKVIHGTKRCFTGNCSDVYIVNVQSVKVYDAPGGRVIGKKNKNDIVETPYNKDSGGEWVPVYFENGEAYILRRELSRPVECEY